MRRNILLFHAKITAWLIKAMLKPESVEVFGSFVANAKEPKDIDLIVIGHRKNILLQQIVTKVCRIFAVDVNFTIDSSSKNIKYLSSGKCYTFTPAVTKDINLVVAQ